MKIFALLFFFISLSIFLLTFLIAFKKHRNLKAALKILLLGIVFTDFVILASLFYYGNVYTDRGERTVLNTDTGKYDKAPFIISHSSEYEIKAGNKPFFSIIYAVIYAPKMGAFGLKYPSLFAAAFKFPWGLGIPYGVFILILSILTPLIFGGFLLSYIKSLWYLLSYYLLRRIRNVYFFSDLNAKSILLAEDILAHKKHESLIVFCNCNKISEKFSEKIDKNHFIVLSENEKDLVIKFSFGNKKQFFFEIAEDDNLNLDSTKKLLEVFDKNKASYLPDVRIFLFMNSSVASSEPLFPDKKEKINIILVNAVKTSIYNLLFEKSFCDELNEKDTLLSISVLGNGAYAKEFFINSIWASILDEKYTIDISFVDDSAEEFKNNLKLECPEIFNQNYNLKFCKCNLQSPDLNEYLLSKFSVSDVIQFHSNYLVIDTGNDEDNIKLAIYIRMFFLRNSKDFAYKPFIALRIKDSKTAKRIRNLKTKDGSSYDLFVFGFEEEIYSYNLIVESPIEKLAFNCHAAYNKSNDDYHYETKANAIFGCNTSEFVKSSNRASAVHIKNKLFLLGLRLRPFDGEPADEEIKENDKALEMFQNKVINTNVIESLQKMEHYRWNAFHFAAGWVNPTLEKSEIYKSLIPSGGKSHIYELAKMHACLCEWNEMPELDAKYGKNFEYYDKIFIEGIPSIIGCRKKDPGNVAGAKFLLERIEK